MTTQYTPTLKLALPVTGELSGTWGDTVNDNITSMVEQAIAGLSTINTWTANSHTLTTANGTTSESRCAMLVAATGAGGTALTGAGEIICPSAAKLYVLQNSTAFVVTLKTSAGTGVAVAAGNTAFLFCDATNVNSCVTTIVNGNVTGNLSVGGNLTVDGNTTLGNATSDTITATGRFNTDLLPSTDNARDLGSAANSWKDLYIDGTATIATLNVTTIDTTNIEVTNIKAKDGTAAMQIADSTGVVTITAAPVMTALTASRAAFTDASKVLVSGTPGTDYVTPGTATTFTALQTFAGTASNADMKTSNILETATVSATAATGTINFDTTTQSVLYYTTNASGNFTVNFRGSSGTTLNAIMATGESLSATFLVTNGATAYYNSAVQVDGSSVTPKWQGGTAPTSGNASSIDSYTYVIIKIGSATFTVLASQTKFA